MKKPLPKQALRTLSTDQLATARGGATNTSTTTTKETKPETYYKLELETIMVSSI